ncbi:MAG: hypothetical protein CVT98_02870 [Bacteroidetes bacterium HGW-Bacteroidetes-15]|nr:MAG: hypothetical protein CVT98_02870 [Bacteroidetes bacterium HGW-Bacteroidetes-15]
MDLRIKIITFILIILPAFSGLSSEYQNKEDIDSRLEILLRKSIEYTESNPDSSTFLALQTITLAIEDNNTLVALKAYHQLGYLYYGQNKFDEAANQFNISLKLAQGISNTEGQALALNRLGNVNQLKTNYLKALDYYLQALEINKQSNHQAEIARTLVNLANVYSVIGQYQRSIEHFLEAMDIHESIGEKEGLAWTSLGIARLFKRLDLLDRSMQYAQSALEYYKEIELQTGKSVGVTLSLNEIGGIYNKLGNYEKALEYTQMVLDINNRTGNVHGQAANHISLGIIFLDKGNYDLARKNLVEALSLKNEIGDSLDLAPLFRYLGQVEMQYGNTKKAYEYFSQSLSFAQKHRLIPDLSEAYLSLSLVFNKTGQFQKSLDAYKNYSSYKDSLNSSDIARLEMQYEFEKREKEQELLARQREALQEARLERQRVVLIFFVVAFLLAGLLAAFIFYGYREKKRINQLLVEQNNEITRQKQEIESQKEEIEQQRDFVTRQRDQIAEQQRLITDSITYASRIQNAVLPGEVSMESLPWESFVFYKPKNIVSGDFYWVSELSNGKIMLAVGDCTGHGVPGAFMSMLGITLLREIAGKDDNLLPADMLMKLRQMVILSLNQQGGKVDQADGMDMAIALIDPKTLVMDFAGAYLSAMIVRDGETGYDLESANPRVTKSDGLSLIELRGDKMPIGHHISGASPFSNHIVQLSKGDMLYLFSDGYVDQFGGEKNIKFLLNNFRRLLFSIFSQNPSKQKDILVNTIEEYKGDKKQVDDMLVLGVRIG